MKYMNNREYLLLIVQVITLAYLLVSAPVFAREFTSIFTECLGLFIGCWAVWIMVKQSVFKVTPHVHHKAKLITTGPYEVIRHPMYAGLLLIIFALVTDYPSLLRFIAALIFIADILFKIYYEEYHLERHFKDYSHYMKKTKRLIPYFY